MAKLDLVGKLYGWVLAVQMVGELQRLWCRGHGAIHGGLTGRTTVKCGQRPPPKDWHLGRSFVLLLEVFFVRYAVITNSDIDRDKQTHR